METQVLLISDRLETYDLLRKAGIVVEWGKLNPVLRTQGMATGYKYAYEQSIPFVIVETEYERRVGHVLLKDMVLKGEKATTLPSAILEIRTRSKGKGKTMEENRTIELHHDGHGLTESIELTCDGPGPGGASHSYTAKIDGVDVTTIRFQKGPRNEKGSSTGVVEAVLLAVLIDRMNSFQAGEYGCRENALVKTKCEEALHWLKARADGRAKRGVLGTTTK